MNAQNKVVALLPVAAREDLDCSYDRPFTVPLRPDWQLWSHGDLFSGQSRHERNTATVSLEFGHVPFHDINLTILIIGRL